MKLAVEISNPKTHQRLDVELPAPYNTLEDALQRLGCNETIAFRGGVLDDFGRRTISLNMPECNIFELNHLSEITQSFEDENVHKFIGGCFLMNNHELSIDKAINLAMNIKENNIVDYQPAREARDLAEFYLENDLIPELADVSDDAYQWIVDHTNLEELGEEICQKENGTFISDAYVTMGELEPLYDGSFRMPVPEKYIFKLEVGFSPEEDDGSIYTLPLPVSHTEIERMMAEMEVKSLSELTCYKFQSTIPLLEPIDFDMTDVDILNQLATSISTFKDNGKLNTYKAMVDALEVIDLESANQLCDYVGEFKLLRSTRSFSAYGRNQLEESTPKELLDCLDTTEYGAKMATQNGVSITSYGALVPKDGVPLLERFSSMNDGESHGFMMGQSM
ncbi:MAG: hypothetical protein R3Y09_04360 [Clostridia bacterium]